MHDLNRRRVLRGMLNGGAVTVGLPLLNVFLNGNGNAMADGTPLPVRFGTWYWGMGISKSVFVPKQAGANYELPEEIESLKDIKQHINLFTNLTAYRDGAFFCHYTGWVVARTGVAPMVQNQSLAESIDTTVANQIGRTTRFKSLTTTSTGDVRDIISYESPTTSNSPEFSPVNFYTRLFGPDFQDPNAPTFTPSPTIMVRKSALTGVMDKIKTLETKVGAEDKARLDQYFTGLRHLENQFNQQLTKPEPREACVKPKAAKDMDTGSDFKLVADRHNVMTDLLTMAIACDQSRVFNMIYSYGFSNTTKPGYDKPHHTCTHEEPKDEKLGYQPNASWFVRRAMESWAYYVKAFASIKEGDGTLLDNCFIMGNSDVSDARVHSLEEMAAFTAGRMGGKIKTGLHIPCNGGKITDIGFTGLKALGLAQKTWGGKSNETDRVISEIIA
ncbi:MAG: DUF1552 domain-containing protein [Rhodospirillaceae bacterium]